MTTGIKVPSNTSATTYNSVWDEYVATGSVASERGRIMVNSHIRNTCQVLTRVDRTLARSSGLRIRTVAQNESDAYARASGGSSIGPAFSNIEQGVMCIDFTHHSFYGANSEQQVAHTLGLNYHELAHLLFTPNLMRTRFDPIRNLVIGDDWCRFAFNYLEDGRIERMMVAKYAATRAFLTVTFLRMLAVTPSPEDAWFFVAPRIGEQPKDVTDAVWDRIMAMPRNSINTQQNRRFTDADLKRAVKIADEYKRLAFSTSEKINRGAALVKSFAAILRKSVPQNMEQGNHGVSSQPAGAQQPSTSRGMNGFRKFSSSGLKQATPKEQQEAQDQRDEDEKEEKREQRRAERERRQENQSEEQDEEQDGLGDDTDDEAESESEAPGGSDGGSDTDDDENESQNGAQSREDDDTDDEADGDDGDSEQGGAGSDSGSESDGSSSHSSGSRDDTEGGESDSIGDDSTDDSEPSQQSGGLAAGGPGKGREFEKCQQDVLDAISQAMRDTMSSSTVQEDVNSHRKALHGHMTYNKAPKLAPLNQLPVTPDMRLAAKRVARKFERLASRLDPGWDKRTSHGRLNVSRFLRERDLDEAFDTWREDKSEAVDTEVVLMMDMSGSMNGFKIVSCSAALWVLRQALASIDAKVTGIGFESNEHLLFTNADKMSTATYPVWNPTGGTSLNEAIETAAAVLTRSKSKSKVLVCITDGHISPGFEDTLTEIRESGVHCSKFGIFASKNEEHTVIDHLFDLNATVSNPLDIIEPVEHIVRRLIATKARVR